MWISTNAQTYDGESNDNHTFAKVGLNFFKDGDHYELELKTLQLRLNEAYIQLDNDRDTPTVLDFEINHTNQSHLKITGQETLEPRSSLSFILKMDGNAIHDLDYLHSVGNEFKKPMWLLGTFAFMPAIFGNGIAAGIVIATIDSHDSKESRSFEYTLQDECILMNLTSTNTSGRPYRLTVTNNFLFAAEADLEVDELAEIAMLPEDMVKIRIMIRPTGRVSCTVRRL